MMRYLCSCVKFGHLQPSITGDLLRRRPFLLTLSILSSHTCNSVSCVNCNKKVHNLTLLPSLPARGIGVKHKINTGLYATSTDRLLNNVAGSGYINNFKCPTKENAHAAITVCNVKSRHLTLSAKAIVDASPVSLQPYLKLIRFDRPIGM
jgi:hypothetical protein